MADILYFFLGLATGGIGTLVGAGGGFLLAPIFIFLFPGMDPARLTALSLLAVAANSVSGSIGYAVRRKIHYPSMLAFSLAAIPGVFVGVQLSRVLPRSSFEMIFGIFLVALSGFVIWRSLRGSQEHLKPKNFWNRRAIVLGVFISFFVGLLSSLLGIGGGIVHVPLLSEVLQYPIHLAAGTSHAILAITSVIAVLAHFFEGDLTPLPTFAPYLVVGLILGAQGGAALSKKVASHRILQVLGIALCTVGVRLIYKNI